MGHLPDLLHPQEAVAVEIQLQEGRRAVEEEAAADHPSPEVVGEEGEEEEASFGSRVQY